jgi:predicted TIM-barrel enzyme
MKFHELFDLNKPAIIGMIHLNASAGETVLQRAKKEIDIYLKHGVYPLIENYFGDVNDCKEVLAWMQKAHPEAIYGINILGDYHKAFLLAKQYGAKFIQIDSVCGHLTPKDDLTYAEKLAEVRQTVDVVLLGGVRFKYQSVNSGRTVAEDLQLATARCDAIVCTGEGTGLATPLKKVAEFKQTLGDFPVIVGAGVTIDTLPDTIRQSEGVIVGSWLKDNHRDYGFVNEKNVELFMAAAGTNR